jgi:group I intron endonuclease
MSIGIYKITSPSGKIYVGQSTNLEKRKDDYKKLKCEKQPKLYNSLQKYGWEQHKFEIIEECAEEQLNKREIYWGLHYDVLDENGLNLKLGDASGLCSKETKQKISLTRLTHPNLNIPSREKHPNVILSEKQVIEIYKLIKKYYSNTEIISKLNLKIQSGSITNIRYGITWNNLWHRYFTYPYPGFPSKKNGVPFRVKMKIIELLDKGHKIDHISKWIKRVNKYDIKYASDKKIWKNVWKIYEYQKQQINGK